MDFLRQPVSEVKVTNIQKYERTGRPIGSEQFINKLELEIGRSLKKQKPGPKIPQGNN